MKYMLDGLDLLTPPYLLDLEQSELGASERALSFSDPLRGTASLVTEREKALRDHLVVWVQGETKDLCRAYASELRSHLPSLRGGAKDVLVEDSGATSAMRLRAIAYDEPARPYDLAYDAANLAQVSFTLVFEPYFYGSAAGWQETRADSGEFAPMPYALDLSALQGAYAAPLKLTVDTGAQPSPDYDLHSLYLALLPAEHADWTGWLVQAEDLDWTNAQVTTLDRALSGSGGENAVLTDGSPAIASIDVASFPAGPYLALARVTRAAQITTRSIAIGTLAAVEIPVGLQYIELGSLILPTRMTTGSDQIPVTITCSGPCWLDYLVFLPLRWGFRRWHPADDGTAATSLVSDGDEFWVGGSVDASEVRGPGLQANGGRLLCLAENVTPQNNDGYTYARLRVDYTPRYGGW